MHMSEHILNATGSAIALSKWEGSVSGSVSAHSTTSHVINTQIPAKKK